jgi:RimJ/RimL family protein N-acetyltransferase
MSNNILLKEVLPEDLETFYKHQQEKAALHMAAFTSKDPTDRNAFNIHWQKIQSDKTVIIKTIITDDKVVGHVLSYETDGKPEVSYWIGQEHWGKGIATKALNIFLEDVNKTRPIYARVAKDNASSIRVLQKCGFKIIEETSGFANARGKEIEELVMVLNKEAR